MERIGTYQNQPVYRHQPNGLQVVVQRVDDYIMPHRPGDPLVKPARLSYRIIPTEVFVTWVKNGLAEINEAYTIGTYTKFEGATWTTRKRIQSK